MWLPMERTNMICFHFKISSAASWLQALTQLQLALTFSLSHSLTLAFKMWIFHTLVLNPVPHFYGCVV